LQARAQAILDDARETSLAMRDESVAFEYQRNAVMTLAVIPTVAALFLPGAIRIFRSEGNAARLRILDYNANGVAEAVAKGEADFGICSIPELEPNTEFEPLFDDQIVLACPKEHMLARQEKITWADIAKETLALPARGTGNRLLIDEAMARAGLPLFWSYEISRSNTALEIVGAGIAVALVPKSSLTKAHQARITSRPITDPAIIRPVGILSRIAQQPTPLEELFKTILRKIAAQ
jgi:DNA-binding transcriptional LysR family regulator